MTGRTLKYWTLSLAVGIAMSLPAAATSFVFTGTDNQGGVPQNGQATFTINATDLVITLENTGGPGQVQDIASELDGINFTLTGGTAGLDSTMITGSSPNGTVDCSSGTCVFNSTPATDGPSSNPFLWTLGGTNPFNLLAGSGSFKPNAIVNNNVAVADGVSNAQHNPLLNGPVTFTIGFTAGTAPTGISGVTFDFGTGPAVVTGNLVPEPAYSSVLLLGILGVGLLLRRRKSTVAE